MWAFIPLAQQTQRQKYVHFGCVIMDNVAMLKLNGPHNRLFFFFSSERVSVSGKKNPRDN